MTANDADRTGPADLAAVAEEQLDLAREHSSRRSATTLMSHAAMRATLIALAEGAELAEHDAPVAATLQVLSGRVVLFAGDGEQVLEAGALAEIPHQRHGLRALADTVLLLTVALG